LLNGRGKFRAPDFSMMHSAVSFFQVVHVLVVLVPVFTARLGGFSAGFRHDSVSCLAGPGVSGDASEMNPCGRHLHIFSQSSWLILFLSGFFPVCAIRLSPLIAQPE